jgi:AcrR family transcriptional regulator
MRTSLAPRQQRSRDTQEKLLVALETLLEERFFEQISVRDLAQEAGLAVGTLYRRFRDKEAMLPALYERYDARLTAWADALWDDRTLLQHNSGKSRIRHLVASHVQFYRDNAPIMRTLYLHTRLHGELEIDDVAARRQASYLTLLSPLLETGDWGETVGDEAIRMFILLLVTSVNEYCLFSDQKPMSGLRLPEENFIEELSRALESYWGACS